MEKFRNTEMQTAYENGGYRVHIHYGKSIRMQMELLMTQLQKVGLIRKAG